MNYILYNKGVEGLEIAILVKLTALHRNNLFNFYIKPTGITQSKFIGLELTYQDNNKTTAAHRKEHLAIILAEIKKLGINTILIGDAEYFKTLTGNGKAEPHYGHKVPCTIEGYEDINVFLVPNYQVLKYNPAMQTKIDYSLNAIRDFVNKSYVTPGTDVLQKEYYPKEISDIKGMLEGLKSYDALTCDIEGLSLDFWECGISTISFAWNKHEGVAFSVDRGDCSLEARKLLKEFFTEYTGKLIYHNAMFDVKVIIYTLWMKHLADYKGMLDGLHIMTRNIECTQIITYLATNNTVKNTLGLKELAAEFMGNYAQEDIKDTSKIPINELLKYNLEDTASTWFVYNKYYPTMLEDKQYPLYRDIFKPAIKTLTQTELCGIPIDPRKVEEAEDKLLAIVKKHSTIILDSDLIKEFQYERLERLADKKTKEAKKKVYTVDDPIIAKEVFNPNSDKQLREFLYGYLEYDVIDLTKGKKPATGAKTLKKLKANAQNDMHKELLDSFVKLSQANKILSTFIKAFKKAQQLPDGSWRLYGNFKLGGTISLRLSSSKP